jgi:hypothetical protein
MNLKVINIILNTGMKQYKLIKEYPGSLKLGSQVSLGNDSYMYWSLSIPREEVESYPEFWEEVKPKEYEILSFKDTDRRFLTTLRDNGYYVYIKVNPKDCPNGKGATLEEMFDKKENPFTVIHSIKRMSDGEVFTVGDKVVWDWTECDLDYLTIKKFYIEDDELLFDVEEDAAKGFNFFSNKSYFKYNMNFRKYVERKPILVTEDGVELYYPINAWFVNEKYQVKLIQVYNNKYEFNISYKYFSTNEAAEKYVFENKPCLSYNDVYMNFDMGYGEDKRLEKLVRRKLKGE